MSKALLDVVANAHFVLERFLLALMHSQNECDPFVAEAAVAVVPLVVLAVVAVSANTLRHHGADTFLHIRSCGASRHHQVCLQVCLHDK